MMRQRALNARVVGLNPTAPANEGENRLVEEPAFEADVVGSIPASPAKNNGRPTSGSVNGL